MSIPVGSDSLQAAARVANELERLFSGHSRAWAINHGGHKPTGEPGGKEWRPVEPSGCLDPADQGARFLAHVTGAPAGCYPVVPGEPCLVRFVAWDFDSKPGDEDARPLLRAQAVVEGLKALGHAVLVNASGSGVAYHVRLCVEPLPAGEARALGQAVLERVGIWPVSDSPEWREKWGDPSRSVEVYPKQAALSGKGVGNLLALPCCAREIPHGRTALLDQGEPVASLERSAEILSAVRPATRAELAPFLVESKRPEPLLVQRENDSERLRSALFALDPDRLPYQGGWLDCLLGIHHAFPGSDGLALAVEWSRTGTAGKFREGEVEGKWRGFGLSKERLVTEATIYKLARDCGWTDSDYVLSKFQVAGDRVPSDASASWAMSGDVLDYAAMLDQDELERFQAEIKERVKDFKPQAWRRALRAVRGRRDQEKFARLGRPVIRTTDRAEEQVRAGERALGKLDVFTHMGGLAVVSQDKVVPLKPAAVMPLLSRAATWVKERDGALVEEIMPPGAVSAAIHAGPWTMIRALRGVTAAPVLRADGSVAWRRGYDDETGFYLTGEWEPEPEPTEAEARASLARILDLFREFAFVSDADRSAALALFLTYARGLADSTRPLFAITAPSAGEGKSLCGSLGAYMFQEAELAGVPPKKQQADEWDKYLLGEVMGGAVYVFIDNLEAPLAGMGLQSALTTGRIKGRPLYGNVPQEGPLPLVVATGKALQVEGDYRRRSVLIRLDSGLENPEYRETSRSPAELVELVRANRRDLVLDCLRVLRWGYGSRAPDAFASFEGWNDVVRAAILRLGLPDPLLPVRTAAGDFDPARVEEERLFVLWFSEFGSEPITGPEFGAWAERDPEVKGILSALGLRPGEQARRLLPKLKLTRNGLRLDHGPRRKSGVTWVMQPAKGMVRAK